MIKIKRITVFILCFTIFISTVMPPKRALASAVATDGGISLEWVLTALFSLVMKGEGYRFDKETNEDRIYEALEEMINLSYTSDSELVPYGLDLWVNKDTGITLQACLKEDIPYNIRDFYLLEGGLIGRNKKQDLDNDKYIYTLDIIKEKFGVLTNDTAEQRRFFILTSLLDATAGTSFNLTNESLSKINNSTIWNYAYITVSKNPSTNLVTIRGYDTEPLFATTNHPSGGSYTKSFRVDGTNVLKIEIYSNGSDTRVRTLQSTNENNNYYYFQDDTIDSNDYYTISDIMNNLYGTTWNMNSSSMSQLQGTLQTGFNINSFIASDFRGGWELNKPTNIDWSSSHLKEQIKNNDLDDFRNTDDYIKAIDNADDIAERNNQDVIDNDIQNEDDVSDNSITEFGLMRILKNWVRWLFVPSDIAFENFINEARETMDEHASLLTYPITLVIEFLLGLSTLNDSDYVFVIPPIVVNGKTIYNGTSFSFNAYIEENNLQNIQNIIHNIGNVIMILGMINLAKKKGDEIIRGN